MPERYCALGIQGYTLITADQRGLAEFVASGAFHDDLEAVYAARSCPRYSRDAVVVRNKGLVVIADGLPALTTMDGQPCWWTWWRSLRSDDPPASCVLPLCSDGRGPSGAF